MKVYRIIIVFLSFLLISVASYPQDIRTIETKVADLLAQFPASDIQYTDKLMTDMLSLGETGIKRICDQVIPAGTGDDTQPRFAIESLSRFLSQYGKEGEKNMWEKICIEYAIRQKDNGVKDFFMKQLQTIGGTASVEALRAYLSDQEICEPALAAILSAGGNSAETALAEALTNRELPCAAAVMNALAAMKSQIAVNEYILWSSDINVNTKASAYNALAQSGSPLAYPVLSKAAKDVLYRWERTGATTALLNYAKNAGQNGDIKTMDKICKLVIAKCNDKLTIQNKSAALRTYVSFHGIDAIKELLKAAAHSNKAYRNTALDASLSVPGKDITQKYIDFFSKATAEAKPEIISMLGIRGDELALPLITSSLKHQNQAVRIEASASLTKISGVKAVSSLVDYLSGFTGQEDQDAAKSALMAVAGSDKISLLKPVLRDGRDEAKKSIIELMAWTRGKEYFSEVLPYTSYRNESVRSAAYKALADLASQDNQTKLIELLAVTDDPSQISALQNALAVAAGSIAEPEKRSDILINSFKADLMQPDASSLSGLKMKIIPILARTGGREALAVVLKEFESGNPEMRDICFKALTSWSDYTASSALYEICASGNKTFEEPAFKGYVRQIRTASLPDDQKLLLYRKIMPYALSSERKNEILIEVGKLKTYQSLFFISNYLDDPATSSAAAKAAMSAALPSDNTGAGMYGTFVREILTKAVPLITGPESEYDKAMLNRYLADMPPDEGFRPMFNGKDLSGWQGLVENPIARSNMRRSELERRQAEADVMVPANWSVRDGCIWFNGKGNNLCSIVEYGDFEMLVDWKISKNGDSGIYLRGTPQVQIWDTSRVEAGAQVGSGGLYNNQINPSKPLKVADNPVGEWNTFRIIMIGEKVSVWLNGDPVVDNVTMENYWDRKIPIFPKGPIELQAHGTDLAFRDIYVREINEKEF